MRQTSTTQRCVGRNIQWGTDGFMHGELAIYLHMDVPPWLRAVSSSSAPRRPCSPLSFSSPLDHHHPLFHCHQDPSPSHSSPTSYRQSVADLHPVGQALRYKTPGPSFNGLLNIFSAGEINSFTIFGQPVIVINSLDVAKDVLVNRSAIIPIAHDWSWAVNSVAGIVPRCWPLRDLNSKGVNCSSLAESARNACWKNIVPWSTWHGALPATLLLIQRTLLDRPTGTYINKRPIEGLNIYHL